MLGVTSSISVFMGTMEVFLHMGKQEVVKHLLYREPNNLKKLEVFYHAVLSIYLHRLLK